MKYRHIVFDIDGTLIDTKNSTGMSFSENIRKLKMHRALRLLENPELSSERIAEILGYADVVPEFMAGEPDIVE